MERETLKKVKFRRPAFVESSTSSAERNPPKQKKMHVQPQFDDRDLLRRRMVFDLALILFASYFLALFFDWLFLGIFSLHFPLITLLIASLALILLQALVQRSKNF